MYVICTGLLAAGCDRVVAQVAPPTDKEEWYVVQMQGQKCGYVKSTLERVGDEVHSRTYTQIEISRGSAKVKISIDQSFRETIDGRPLSFCHKMSMGSTPTVMTGTLKDGSLTLLTDQFGLKREATYDFDPDIKFTWGQFLEQQSRGFKPGTAYTMKVYEPSQRLDGPIEVEIKVRGKEKVEVLGKERMLIRVTATMLLAMPIPTETWIDEEGNLIVTTVDLGILKLKMFAASREQALGDIDAPELFISTFVRTNRNIDRDAAKVKLRLRLRAGQARRLKGPSPAGDGPKLPDLPQTGMQSVKRISDREAILTIHRLDWKKIRAATGTTTNRDKKKLKEYLRASTLCDIDDKKIRRLARKAVKGCKTPAEKADALRRTVTRYVKNKSLDVAFATASEVARTKQGDCSEHAVLLAALARAANLPARGVSGIVQIPPHLLPPGMDSAFGYHMWTQVHIDGRWVDIDAAMRQTDCDPTHIAVTLMPLNDEGMLDQVMSLLPLLGHLEIEVLEVEH
jgi:hypothetical protein